jgi:hypothetical protein
MRGLIIFHLRIPDNFEDGEKKKSEEISSNLEIFRGNLFVKAVRFGWVMSVWNLKCTYLHTYIQNYYIRLPTYTSVNTSYGVQLNGISEKNGRYLGRCRGKVYNTQNTHI